MRSYITTESKHWEEKILTWNNGDIDESYRINVYPDMQKQEMVGFGGAFTESTCYILSMISEEKRNHILDLYFSENGIQYNLCRTHIQSCDFSLSNYAYIDDENDRELKTFTLDRDSQYMIPIIKEAKNRANELELIASPWSPPKFMKSNQNMNCGGILLPEFADMWADMIVKYLLEYKKMGIEINRITLQNEPDAVQQWDSCIYSASEEGNFIVSYLKPALIKSGLNHIKIYIWDHNKEAMVDRVKESFLVPGAKDVIDGVAFHWYTGDHFDAITLTLELFPEKEMLFTEGCVEYSKYSGKEEIKNAEMYAHDMIGNLNAGMNGYMDWNMVLDIAGGPNHVGNYCDAPVMCDIEQNEIHVNQSFYYIGHFSRFIQRGARRIATTKYTDQLEITAYQNANGSRVLIILNRTDKLLPVHMKENNNFCRLQSIPHSIQTIVWE